MAYGTLQSDAIQTSAAGTPPQFLDSGGAQSGVLCRSWVKFSGAGGTPSIGASFNVSSVTFVSTGVFNITMTNAMPDANYAVVASVNGSGVNNFGGTEVQNVGTSSASVYCVRSYTTGGAAVANLPYYAVAIFR